MIGRKLANYEITAKLGEGGMGSVYRARDSSLEREVAIKILPPGFATDPDRLERFRREAKALAALDHPNIVTVHSIEDSSGIHFLTMSLVEGVNLEHAIPSGGMDLDEIFGIAIPIADALSAAHEKRITHRDLKPANVMVTDERHVKVLDFGLAKLERTGATDTEATTQALTREGAVVGTVPYMSPEQVQGQPVDHRTDIFSLGVLIYEMASGKRPFGGNNAVSLASSILRDTPPALDEIRRELPHHLSRVVERCLEKNPKRRYQTALDVRNELDGLRREIERQSRSPSRPGAIERRASWRWGRRRAVGALGLLATILAVWIASRAVDPGSDPVDIVVLPFENLGHPDDDYFTAGITDELTGRLATVSGLRVISRNSAAQYAQSSRNLQEIGSELDVDFVIDGTVRWARTGRESRVRVTPRLTSVASDSHVWARIYDRGIEDVFQVQTEIATEVIDALGVTLLGHEETAIKERPTSSLEAYQAYLRGMEHLHHPNLSAETFGLAVEMFDRAVDVDPEFAQAHAQLAVVSGLLHWYGYDPSEERRSIARRSAERALEIMPDLAQSHEALGAVRYYVDRDFRKALQAFRTAHAIAPSDGRIVVFTSFVLRRLGEFEEAVEMGRKACELDPRVPDFHNEVAGTLRALHRYDEALAHLNRSIALQPDQATAYRSAASVQFLLGNLRAGAEVLDRLPRSQRDDAIIERFTRRVLERRYRDALDLIASAPEAIHVDQARGVPRDLLAAMALHHLGEEDGAAERATAAAALLEARLGGETEVPAVHSYLGLSYALMGRSDDAVGAALEGVRRESNDAFKVLNRSFELLPVYMLTGDLDRALDELARQLSPPSLLSAEFVALHPLYDSLRQDARYLAMVEP